MPDKSNVAAGKPNTAGAMWTAPTGTTLPTDATTTLADDFVDLGYVSEDGLSQETSRDNEEIKAWGGDVVKNLQTGFIDKFKVKLIESLNTNVLEVVFGEDNVSGDLDTGITVQVNSEELEERSFVIETILGTALKRIVVPYGKVTEIAEITYKDSDVVGYELTISAMPDSSGQAHYEYIITAS